MATTQEDTPVSTGVVNANAQQARDDGANTVIPPGPSLKLNSQGRIETQPSSSTVTPTTVTNAIPTGAGSGSVSDDAGTNAPVRTLNQTQAVPPLNSAVEYPDAPVLNNGITNASRDNGVPREGLIAAIANGDDYLNPTRQTIVNYFNGANSIIEPQTNPLSKYSSYTYNISIYLLSPDDARKIIENKRPLVSNAQLLIQSGGAPVKTDVPAFSNGTGTPTYPTPDNTTAPDGRNPEFPLDFYIDNVKIHQVQPGKGTRAANGVTNIEFTITEPNGITLLDNLYAATAKYVGEQQNYARQTYLMAIRFYGYDENGNLAVATGNRDPSTLTDPNAVIEKFIPFQFISIAFRIANKVVEYNCSATVPQNNIGTSQPRGVIPFNVESSASTVGELFTGTSGAQAPFSDDEGSTQTNNPPQKANAAATNSVSAGVITAMNEYEAEFVRQGKWEIANEYEIIFTDPILSDAKLMPTGSTQKNQTSTIPTGGAVQQISGARQSVDTESRKVSAIAGTSIIQFLDQVLRSSQYIFDQQTYVIDPSTGDPIPQGSGRGASVVAWYRIATEAVPLGWDTKRNDYAYRITYQVSPYLVNDLQSSWFPQSSFRGVHKRYNYWFTGENTEVLNYEQDFNYLYYIVEAGNQIEPGVTYNWRETIPRQFQPNSNETNKGLSNNVNEPGANAAERLYSPGDLARAQLSILGDPAWIFQGDIWSGLPGTEISYNPFLGDGTINHEIQEPLFEISFNKPADYNLETGIINPVSRSASGNKLSTLYGDNEFNFVYRLVTVTSSFVKGRFTQDLEGVIVQFPYTAIVQGGSNELEGNYLEIDRNLEIKIKGEQIANQIQQKIKQLGSLVSGFLKPKPPVGNSANPGTADPSTPAPQQVEPPTSSGQSVAAPAPANTTTETATPSQNINREF